MNDSDTRDVRVKIEDAATIYVGWEAVDALRDDANAQLHEAITAVHEIWSGDGPYVSDLAYLKTLEWPLINAKAALSVLVQLAPVPNDEDA